MLIHEICLEIKNIRIPHREHVKVKQLDQERTLRVTILDGNKPADLSNYLKPELRLKRPDGKILKKIFRTLQEVDLTAEMLAIAGACLCDVVLIHPKTGGELSTECFVVEIGKSPTQSTPDVAIDAAGINEGYVLTANGMGGYSWKQLPGGTGADITPEVSFDDQNKNSTSKVPSMAAVSDLVNTSNANKVDYVDGQLVASDGTVIPTGDGGSSYDDSEIRRLLSTKAEGSGISFSIVNGGLVATYEA